MGNHITIEYKMNKAVITETGIAKLVLVNSPLG